MMKLGEKVFLVVACILLLCVGAVTVFAAVQPSEPEEEVKEPAQEEELPYGLFTQWFIREQNDFKYEDGPFAGFQDHQKARKAAEEFWANYYAHLPLATYVYVKNGIGEDFYAACAEYAKTEEQREALITSWESNLQYPGDKKLTSFPREALQIVELLPQDQPRLTREDVEALWQLERDGVIGCEQDRVDFCNRIAGVPDCDFEGITAVVVYYLNDEGTVYYDAWSSALITISEDGSTLAESAQGQVYPRD